MALTEQRLLHFLGRMPFIDSAELAFILGEPHTTVHRVLTDLLADGIAERASHGTVHLPSSQRYYLTANGAGEAAQVLDFDTPSDFVRAYPMSKEWLTLLIRRLDAVASIYRLAATMSPGTDGLWSRVEFHRRGRFDATITLHDGRSFGVVRQGLALRHRSLYDRLQAIAEYNYRRRPDTVLVLVPSVWEERLTTRFCEERNLDDCYVAVESRGALERLDRRLWCKTSWVVGSRFFSLKGVISRSNAGGGPRTQSPERKRASIPQPDRMVETAPAFGISPSEKRTLDLITDHPMIPREHLRAKVEMSRQPHLKECPVLIVDRDPSRARAVVVDRFPTASGVTEGMAVEQALSLHANAAVLDADEPHYRRVFGEVLASLQRVGDRVEGTELGTAYVRLDGLEGMYHGEAGVVSALLDAVPSYLTPRIGVADAKFPAFVAARTCSAHRAFRVPKEVATFLAPHTIDLLPVPAEMKRELHRFGLHAMGAVASISVHMLADRFGPDGGGHGGFAKVSTTGLSFP